MNRDPAAAESLDRLAEEGLRRVAVAQERGRPGPDAERPVGADGPRSFIELAQGPSCDITSVASGTRLDQFDKRPAEETQILVRTCALRGEEGIFVAAEAV